MWGKKKPEVVERHIETAAEYWAKRDAARAAQQAQAAAADDNAWTGYSAPPAVSPDDEATLFSYELSAYSDTVGYHSDGIQRVSRAFTDEQLAAYRQSKGR